MNQDELISALRARVASSVVHTDRAHEERPILPSPATQREIDEAQKRMGFKFHSLHRRVLLEVANGGFGPGDGLVGLSGGRLDAHGRSLIDLRDTLWFDEETALPVGVVPVCDLGDGAWLCLDELSEDGRVLILDELGLTDSGKSFAEVLSCWVIGENVDDQLFSHIETTRLNPFTHKPVTYQSRGRPRGVPYVSKRS